jgi:uncharacterized protein (TIGR03435 family)
MGAPRLLRFAVILMNIALVAADAQTNVDLAIRFEVASIKPGTPGMIGPNIYNPTRERFAVESITTKALIGYAYDVREFQISGGPGWLRSEEYTIVARPGGDAGRERILAMVRNLLAERFQLTVHHESKEMPVLELVIAKGGPKLRPSPRADGPEVRGGRSRLIARNVTMEMLAAQLAGRVLVRPILDRTGLKGAFDVDLEWTPDENPDAGPSVFTALEEQLGLKLEARKGPVDVLVIDHVERPTEN